MLEITRPRHALEQLVDSLTIHLEQVGGLLWNAEQNLVRTNEQPSPIFATETWFRTCFEQHWKLGHYAVTLPCDRWLPRLPHWKPIGQHRVGRPRGRHAENVLPGNGSWPHDMVAIGRH